MIHVYNVIIISVTKEVSRKIFIWLKTTISIKKLSRTYTDEITSQRCYCICNKDLSNKFFSINLQIHTEENPYKCSHRDKAYIKILILSSIWGHIQGRDHMNATTGIRPSLAWWVIKSTRRCTMEKIHKNILNVTRVTQGLLKVIL